MRTFWDILTQTIRTLWAHKLRSFLTMFGIAWGVGSLLLLVGIGEGFRTGNKKQLDEIGENIIFIFPGRVPAVQGQGQNSAMRRYYITQDDYAGIAQQPHVKWATPVLVREDIRVVSETQNSNGQVAGSLPIQKRIRFLPLASGRWLNDLDEEQRRMVTVIGWEMKRNLFPDDPKPLGKFLLIGGYRFEVIGVISNFTKDEGNSSLVRCYIPFSTMATYFPVKTATDVPNAVSFVNFTPTSAADHDLARNEARAVVARNHNFDPKNEDAFEDWDTVKNQEMVGKIFDAMNLFLGSVGLVTLALGAIGIINIMLVSVAERTKEIGLRKALGATNSNILTQFLLEGVILTVISGGIGMGAAAGLMSALHQLPSPPGFDPPTLVLSSAILAVGSLSLAGIVAGVYPARKAAALQPVEALRQE
ncbi:MAG TPA: ABC transporter permease [Terriglobales bacterium]|nr:ABC transporter permease [Terriglobales bacterium]